MIVIQPTDPEQSTRIHKDHSQFVLERNGTGFARSGATHPERTSQSLSMEKGRNIMKQSKGAMGQISAIVFSKRFSRALAAALILAVCGMAYAAGEDKAQPAPGSFESVKQLAEKGNAEAQLKLAQMYQEGKGVAQNLQEAVNWSRKAAEQGLAQAQFLLGQMYASGKGVAKDVKEAAKWLQKAADQGLQAAKDEIKKLGAAAPSLDDEIDKAIKMIR
jgi:TPR repeat protein